VPLLLLLLLGLACWGKGGDSSGVSVMWVNGAGARRRTAERMERLIGCWVERSSSSSSEH